MSSPTATDSLGLTPEGVAVQSAQTGPSGAAAKEASLLQPPSAQPLPPGTLTEVSGSPSVGEASLVPTTPQPEVPPTKVIVSGSSAEKQSLQPTAPCGSAPQSLPQTPEGVTKVPTAAHRSVEDPVNRGGASLSAAQSASAPGEEGARSSGQQAPHQSSQQLGLSRRGLDAATALARPLP